MHLIRLLHTCGHLQIDSILQGLIGVFEAVFPSRIRSYYLVGSYSTGGAGPLSDIDLRVIFKGQFLAGEEEKMLQIRHYCRQISPVALDCPLLSEQRLLHDAHWLHEPLGIKATGILLYGEEIHDQWPPPDFAAYLRDVTAVPVARFSLLRQGLSPLVFPLAYPEPAGAYYGYDQLDARTGERTLKLWVHAVGFVATCIVALKAGRIVASKEEWLPMYQQYIGDEWSEWLATVYRKGIWEWGYRIPIPPDEQAELRDLCRRTLPFENHYLRLYLAYLSGELHAAEPARRAFASERLRDIALPDAERSTLQGQLSADNE